MQDRPTYDELLAALEHFLSEEALPGSEGARRFNARVAANVVGMLRRELQTEESHLAAEWSGLDGLLGVEAPPSTRSALRDAIRRRNETLCQRIRNGDAEAGPFREAVLAHVRATVHDKLLVSNPGWLGKAADG